MPTSIGVNYQSSTTHHILFKGCLNRHFRHALIENDLHLKHLKLCGSTHWLCNNTKAIKTKIFDYNYTQKRERERDTLIWFGQGYVADAA